MLLGLLRSASPRRVLTNAGHSTETPTLVFMSSACIDSESATTANLVAAYALMYGAVISPPNEAVFTT